MFYCLNVVSLFYISSCGFHWVVSFLSKFMKKKVWLKDRTSEVFQQGICIG